MELIIKMVNWAMVYGPELVSAVIMVMMLLISFFMIIPGEQPEKFLQQVVDFLKKYSKK